MTIDRSQVQVGLEVVGLDATDVGEVKEVRDTDFLVSQPMQRDVYVPFNAIHDMEVTAGGIVLAIPAAEVDNMNWSKPPIPGEPGAGVGDPGILPHMPWPGAK